MRTPQPMAAAMSVVGELPPRVDLTLYQGDDFYLNITLDIHDYPIDLTLYTPKAEIRATPGGPEVLAEFDVTVTDATHLMLHLPSVESTKLSGTVSWDVQIEDSAGVITTLAYGQATVQKQVTL